jgi:hypothetical protein
MDKRFLEFWGNLLINAAKGQEQIENLQRLIDEGFKPFETQLNLFRKFYGLENKTGPPAVNDQLWEKATQDFLNSCEEFIGIWGMVPRKTYDALAGENENLKKKIADLEKRLQRRKQKGNRQEMDTGEIARGFEGLIKKQAEQFQTLMAAYGSMCEDLKKQSSSHAPESTEK